MRGAHPPDNVLEDYGLGKLDGASVETIDRHVTTCHDCRKRVAELSADSFLDRMLGAAPKAATLAPSRIYSNHAAAPPAPPPAAPEIPPELADMRHYENVRELGQGGMGVVYLAHNALMGRDEVLKIVNNAMLGRTGGTERFLREIRSAARLNEPKAHQNIVKVYNAQQAGELIVFSMEYIAGEYLSKVLKAAGPLPVHKACGYAYHAALGLQHAHAKGMVHRDIKPSNLMLTREDGKAVVKILDFGLAKTTREIDASSELTGAGKTLGTPPYMAPEQIADATTADIRADVYSLGCTLYHLLTGNPPFVETNIYALLLAHKERTPTPLDAVRGDVPPALAAAVAKMLAKDPADRFQTPTDAAKALKPFLTPSPSGTAWKTTVPPQPAVPSAVFEASTERPGATVAGDEPRRVPVAVPVAKRRPGRSSKESSAGRPRNLPFWSNHVIGAGIAVAVLTVVIGLWASGVIRVRTPQGVLVVEVNEPGADVYVDGQKVTVTWAAGGRKAEITVPAGTYQVEVKKDGFTAAGKFVMLSEGKRKLFEASLVPLKEKQDLPPPPPVLPHGKPEPTIPNQVPTGTDRSTSWKQGSVWSGTGRQEPGGTFDIKITVLKRDGDAFEGHYDVYNGLNVLTIRGTVRKTGAVAWRFTGYAKLGAAAVNIGGAKFDGTIAGDTATVPYLWDDHPSPGQTTPGKLELKLQPAAKPAGRDPPTPRRTGHRLPSG